MFSEFKASWDYLAQLAKMNPVSRKQSITNLIETQLTLLRGDEHKGLAQPLRWSLERGLIAAISASAFSFIVLASLTPLSWGLLTFDHALAYLLAIPSLALGALAYAYSAYPGAPFEHISGMNFRRSYLLTQKDMRELEGEQIEREMSKPNATPGLFIGDFVQISRQRETGHISVNGVPGGGKTVLFKYLLKQMIEHEDRILIHDPKGDYTSFLPSKVYKGGGANDTNVFEEAQAVIFAPWDERGVWWDVGSDITNPQIAQTFAKTLFPDTGGDGQFWNDAAREVMGAAISYLIQDKGTWTRVTRNIDGTQTEKVHNGGGWSWRDLSELFSQGPDFLIDKAHIADPNIKNLIAKASEKAKSSDEKVKQNVMATIASKIGWIGPYANSFEFKPEDRFSITEWLKKTPRYANTRFVILQNNLNYKARSEQIFNALLSCFSAFANSSSMREIEAHEPGYYMLLDEYPQLGKGASEFVQTTMELGRSRGIRVIFAYQDESQLDAIFGREQGRVQRALQQTKIYCKSDKETAKEAVAAFGKREVYEVSDVARGARYELQRRMTVKDVVNTGDFTGLKIIGKGKDEKQATGAEFAIFIDDKGGKSIVSFTEMKEVREKTIESKRWQFGLLSWAQSIENDAKRKREQEIEVEKQKGEVAKVNVHNDLVKTDAQLKAEQSLVDTKAALRKEREAQRAKIAEQSAKPIEQAPTQEPTQAPIDLRKEREAQRQAQSLNPVAVVAPVAVSSLFVMPDDCSMSASCSENADALDPSYDEKGVPPF